MYTELLDRIIDAQVEYILTRFGKDISYEMGWGIDSEEVVTKVYGDKGGILVTGADLEHDFTPFGEELDKKWGGINPT